MRVAAARARPRARLLLALAASLATLSTAAIAPAPAGAVISGRFGIQERTPVHVNAAEPLQYHGGPVLHSSDVYAIYWDPIGSYRGDWKRLINGFFQSVGAASGSLEDVFALNGQYTDASGRAANELVFRGSYTDVNPYPSAGCTAPATAVCLNDEQIRTELQRVIASGELPGATGTPIYYVLTPPGVTVCTEATGGQCSVSSTSEPNPPTGMCGYHSAINPTSPQPIIYAVQPWVAGNAGAILTESPLATYGPTSEVFACQDNSQLLEEPNQLAGVNPFGAYEQGLADVIINDLSIEQTDIVVDPLLNGWYQTSTEAEQADMCQWHFGPIPEPAPEEGKYTHAATVFNESIAGNKYYLQYNFSSAGVTSGAATVCWPAVTDEPHFTTTNPVIAGDVIALDATESLLTLAAKPKGLPANEPYSAPIYKWEFGDGTSVSGTEDASVFHTFAYAGTYEVKLTVIDSGGNVGTFTGKISVSGKQSPAGEREKEEQERLKRETAEKEQAEKEKLEREKKAEQELLEREKKAEQEKLAREKLEREAAEKEKAEREKAEKEKAEREAAEKIERERTAELERAARERATEREKAERERATEREKAEREKAAEAERVAREKAEREKSEKEKAEREAAEKAAKEKSEREAAEKAAREAAEEAAHEAAEKEAQAIHAEAATPSRPTASASVLSSSLKEVLSGGLPILYRVNERVTGRVELLLASSVATQLGVKGTPASDLPAGAPPAVVIARAVLVTTSAGEGHLSIKLSKSADEHLRSLRQVAVTLRLVVSGAAGATPTTISHPLELRAQ